MKKLILVSGLLVGVSLSSVSFAENNFYCPAPSSIKAVPATNPSPPSPGFNYVATDEAGVQFESIAPVIGGTAPTIVSFDSATWTNITNSGGYNGDAICFYSDSTGLPRSLTAKVSQSVMYEGSAWSNPGTPFYQCTSKNKQDCAFKFV
jgi:hypothetical protein